MVDRPEIDAVVTWVDGNDPVIIKKRNEFLSVNKTHEISTGKDQTRFTDNGEIYYCLKSIRKFAPWIRQIHLVTDNQKPDFLTSEFMETHKIRLVSHKEIFKDYPSALPTFNTRTIESGFINIEGLSPYFIYFNDDFILTGDVQPEDFFRDGKPVLRGQFQNIIHYGAFRVWLNHILTLGLQKLLGITRSMHLLLQVRSAQLAGFDKYYYRSPHVPHPVMKKTLTDFVEKNPDLYENNLKYKFRSTEQFSAIFLANHLEVKKNNAIITDADDALTINGEMMLLFMLKRKLTQISRDNIKFLCMQAFEKLNKREQQFLKSYLDRLVD